MKFEVAKEEDADVLIFSLELYPAGVKLRARNKIKGSNKTLAFISEKGIALYPVDDMGIAMEQGKIKVIS